MCSIKQEIYRFLGEFWSVGDFLRFSDGGTFGSQHTGNNNSCGTLVEVNKSLRGGLSAAHLLCPRRYVPGTTHEGFQKPPAASCNVSQACEFVAHCGTLLRGSSLSLSLSSATTACCVRTLLGPVPEIAQNGNEVRGARSSCLGGKPEALACTLRYLRCPCDNEMLEL